MTKRSLPFLRCLCAGLALVLARQPAPAAVAEASTKPNVLLLIADDMNSWLLGDPARYAGRIVAPNLLKFADSGVNFARAYTTAPVCSPSRTAFMSGMAPWTTGHYQNALKVDDSRPLKQAVSLATFFKNAGYSTRGYGKITHGWDQRQGWDEHVGHKRDPAPPGAPLTSVGRGEHDWGAIHLAEEEMNDTQNVNRAIAALERDHDKPFFIACGTFNPHMPWYVPQKYFDLFPLEKIVLPAIKEDDLDDLPPTGVRVAKSGSADKTLAAGLHASAVRAYLATTAYVDTQMGRILDALDRSPHKDNTIVVFLSDHGFHLGEKRHWQKTTLWEEGTHCLLMIRAPGVTPRGRVSQCFVSLLDLYPTLAELCGIEPPKYLDGRSLTPLLKNPDAPWRSAAITGLADKRNPEDAYLTVRNELGRYIRYVTGEEELYDTTRDPHEWTNEIGNPDYATVLQQLRAALPPTAKIAPPLRSALPDKKARKERTKPKKRR